MADSTTVDEPVVTRLSGATSTAFEGDRTESVELHGVSATRVALKPGWGAEAGRDGTEPDYCQNVHDIYIVSGTLGLELDDGAQTEIAAGCATTVLPGHRSWTVGDERLAYLKFDPSE